jgi:hypothetical protein
MSEVVIQTSEMGVAEKIATPEQDADVAPKKPKLDIDDPMEAEESAPETGVGCQCSIEGRMEPDDTSILVSFKFPDKEYDGEVEDAAAQMVSTLRARQIFPIAYSVSLCI